MSIIPFSNGSQYADWQSCNCERCQKSVTVTDPGGDQWPTCEIESALLEADIFDGRISDEIAQRMGYDQERYVWPCGEVQWTEEWKAELRRRRAMQPCHQ